MTSTSGSTDANALEQLLKPQGKLFQALLAFATDDSVSFIFPSSRLPGNTKRLLASGEVNVLSQIYKLKVSHVSRFPQDRFGSHLPDISLSLFFHHSQLIHKTYLSITYSASPTMLLIRCIK